MANYVIYGAGGHANVVADLVQLNGGELTCFFDDSPAADTDQGEVPAIPYQDDTYQQAKLVIGIGHNGVREKLAQRVSHRFATLLHPAASVAASAHIGAGTVVLSKSIIQANASIGNHCIINAGACVDHDAVIEDFVHIAPNAYIGGGAVIKKGALIGAGAVVMRNTVIETGTEVLPLTRVG
jgi:acetyltransferase EpsM